MAAKTYATSITAASAAGVALASAQAVLTLKAAAYVAMTTTTPDIEGSKFGNDFEAWSDATNKARADEERARANVESKQREYDAADLKMTSSEQEMDDANAAVTAASAPGYGAFAYTVVADVASSLYSTVFGATTEETLLATKNTTKDIINGTDGGVRTGGGPVDGAAETDRKTAKPKAKKAKKAKKEAAAKVKKATEATDAADRDHDKAKKTANDKNATKSSTARQPPVHTDADEQYYDAVEHDPDVTDVSNDPK
jgi:hypothetical protein